MTGEYQFIFLSKLYSKASKNRYAFVVDKQNDGSVAREVVILWYFISYTHCRPLMLINGLQNVLCFANEYFIILSWTELKWNTIIQQNQFLMSAIGHIIRGIWYNQ